MALIESKSPLKTSGGYGKLAGETFDWDEGFRDTCRKQWEAEQKKLGEGSFGHVFGACRTTNGTKSDDCNYVVKVQKAGERFDAEVRILQLLQESKVTPRLYDSWVCNGYGYMVSQRMVGDLDVELKRTSKMAAEDIKRVQELLAAIHHQHVAWLDLASRNLLRGSDGLLYATDFGVSLHFRNNTELLEPPVGGDPVAFADAIELDWEAYRAWEQDVGIFLE